MERYRATMGGRWKGIQHNPPHGLWARGGEMAETCTEKEQKKVIHNLQIRARARTRIYLFIYVIYVI